MAAARLRALLLTTVLTAAAPVCHAEPSAEPGQTGETVVQADGADDGSVFQTLSTLGVLSLGILGLLWVRRHTAEL